MNIIDLTGQRIGRWIVVERAGSNQRGSTLWLCRCQCGTEKIVVGIVLRDQRSQSCGCLKREIISERSVTHGHRVQGVTPTYHSWASMIARTTRPQHKNFPEYLGRGITVCDRWRIFENFLADMGEKPAGRSLGRIGNDKGYAPENCRWETTGQQARNRRNNRVIEFNGQRRTIAGWAECLGIPANTIAQRLSRGWVVSKALNLNR